MDRRKTNLLFLPKIKGGKIKMGISIGKVANIGLYKYSEDPSVRKSEPLLVAC